MNASHFFSPQQKFFGTTARVGDSDETEVGRGRLGSR